MAESEQDHSAESEQDHPDSSEVTVSEADLSLVDALTAYTRSDALTFQEQRFVMFCLKGLQPVAAARAAGYKGDFDGPKLLLKKKIRQAMQNVTEYELHDTRVTREKLTHMLFEAHSHAANATEEINAIRELGKMHGTYEATKIAQTIDVTAKVSSVKQLEQLDDNQLAKIAGEKPLFDPEDAIEGVFTEEAEADVKKSQ